MRKKNRIMSPVVNMPPARTKRSVPNTTFPATFTLEVPSARAGRHESPARSSRSAPDPTADTLPKPALPKAAASPKAAATPNSAVSPKPAASRATGSRAVGSVKGPKSGKSRSLFWTQGPFEPLAEQTVRGLTAREVTDAMDQRARLLLNSPSALAPPSLEFPGSDVGTNEFVSSLCAPVPREMYTPANVFARLPDGSIEFAKWFWTFGGVIPLNIYVGYFNHFNPGLPFPKDEYLRQRRQVKNRAYQRRSRAKARVAPLPEPD